MIQYLRIGGQTMTISGQPANYVAKIGFAIRDANTFKFIHCFQLAGVVLIQRM
jgi:hypothetical protein